MGFLRVVAALFVEPVRYLQRLIHQCAGIGEDGLGAENPRKQGLLATMLSYLQVALVIGAIGGLAFGILGTWNTLQPSPGAVEQLHEARTEYAQLKENLASSQERLRAMETGMAQKRTEAVATFKGERQRIINEAIREMANAERTAVGQPGGADALGKIKTFIAGKQSLSMTWEAKDTWGKLDSFLNYNPALDANAKTALHAYVDQWQKKSLAQIELATFDENQILRQLEADRQRLAEETKRLESAVQSRARYVERCEEAASFRFKSATLVLLTSLLQCLGLIWGAGLLLEFFETGLRVARHIHEVRDQLKGELRAGTEVEQVAVPAGSSSLEPRNHLGENPKAGPAPVPSRSGACPKCGFQVESGAEFCGNCGAKY